jgi:hypothetical protein
MAELVANCPRCGAQEITFDVHGATQVARSYDWQSRWEAFCICRKCKRATVFVLEQNEVDDQMLRMSGPDLIKLNIAFNRIFRVNGYINISDMGATEAPEHLSPAIKKIFDEAAKCVVVKCWNAAGCMFRLCIDMTTRDLLPAEDIDGLDTRIRRELGRRLAWLFKTDRLTEALRELSTCIREDGNDGAHTGMLTEADALDLQDFTYALLDRHYSEPARLRIAKTRRDERRKPKT